MDAEFEPGMLIIKQTILPQYHHPLFSFKSSSFISWETSFLIMIHSSNIFFNLNLAFLLFRERAGSAQFVFFQVKDLSIFSSRPVPISLPPRASSFDSQQHSLGQTGHFALIFLQYLKLQLLQHGVDKNCKQIIIKCSIEIKRIPKRRRRLKL